MNGEPFTQEEFEVAVAELKQRQFSHIDACLTVSIVFKSIAAYRGDQEPIFGFPIEENQDDSHH